MNKAKGKSPIRSASSTVLSTKRNLILARKTSDWDRQTDREENIFPILPTPGPGAYEPYKEKQNPVGTFPKEKYSNEIIQEDNYSYYFPPEFGSDKTVKIGSRPPSLFTNKEELPGPGAYTVEKTNLGAIGHKISNRSMPTFETITPGPGAYNHNTFLSETKRSILYTTSRDSDLFKDNTKTPGPGSYEVSKPKTKSKEIICFDGIMIKMSRFADPEDAKRYMKEHPELKETVHLIMEMMIRDKPDEPLRILRDYFGSMTTKTVDVPFPKIRDELAWLYS